MSYHGLGDWWDDLVAGTDSGGTSAGPAPAEYTGTQSKDYVPVKGSATGVDQNTTGGTGYQGSAPPAYKGAQSKDYVPATGGATSPVDYGSGHDRDDGATTTDSSSFWDSGPSMSSSFAPDAGTVATPAPTATKTTTTAKKVTSKPPAARPPATKTTARSPLPKPVAEPAGLSSRTKVAVGVGLVVAAVGAYMVFKQKDKDK